MDCGPASLKALLEGHGIHASYGRLREACQTGVDGTSIDALETAAVQLGLQAEQVMLPRDHVFAPESSALPALVVVRQASGQTHFVVVWSRHAGWLQVMDPSIGRRWVRTRRFFDDLYLHTQPVPADAWAEWAATEAFQKPLAGRIRRLGGDVGLIATAPLARLDAAARMVEALAAGGALRRGSESGGVLAKLAASSDPIPMEYWSAGTAPDDPDTVLMRGAVLLQVKGAKRASVDEVAVPELAAALAEKPDRPLRQLIARVPKVPALVVAGALAVAAGAVVTEAVLLRGFFDLARELAITGQRTGALATLLAFSLILLALEFSIIGGVFRLARTLEVRLRLAFLEKVPRLEDRYFQSRPISDMGDRSHNVHRLRTAPDLASRFLRALFEMALTAAAVAWFYPHTTVAVAALAVLAIAIPLAAQPALAERDLRLRSHSGALTRFYLDALLGLTAIRAHRAARAVRREQEVLLGEWARAGLSLQRAVVTAEGLQVTASLALAAWIVWSNLQAGGDAGGVLLLVYWVLNLPTLGRKRPAPPGNIRCCAPPRCDSLSRWVRRKHRWPNRRTRLSDRRSRSRTSRCRPAGTRSSTVSARKSRPASTSPSWDLRAPASRASWDCCSDGIARSRVMYWWTSGHSMPRRSTRYAAPPPGWIRRCSCGIARSKTTCVTVPSPTRPLTMCWSRPNCATCSDGCRGRSIRCSARAARWCRAAKGSAFVWVGR